MNFGNISQLDCVNVPPPADPRCADDAFRLANPSVCPTEPQLVIKPAVALACALGGIQFKAFYVTNGQETDVTSQTSFASSNTDVAVVGASSGNATGLSSGDSTISATYLGKTAFADFTVLGDNCCNDQNVAIMVVVDRSKSMSQQFNGSYQTKLVYAKAAASQFIGEINQTKDVVGLLQFTATSNELLSPPIADKDAVQALVSGIAQTSQLTTFYDALSAAVAALAAITADRKLLLIISDGEDTDDSYSTDDNPIDLISDFRTQGGIVMCLGVRAHDRGYALLSALATGGFFINAHDDTAAAALAYISGLKGYVCAGNCVPAGDEYVPSGSLNYCGFANWSVVDGHVDLIGSGFMDLLPGNGLYVDLAGSRATYKGMMVTRATYAVESAKTYRLTARLAGNQRVNAPPNSVRLRVFSRNNDGLANPSNAPTVNLVESGSALDDAETHEYAYSYLNANGETQLSPTDSVEVTQDAPTITLEADVNALASIVRFYRRLNGVWYLIGEADPNSPTLVDTMTDLQLLTALAAGTIDPCGQPSDTNTTGTPIYLLNQLVQINNWQQDFSDIAYTFVAPGDADVYISVQQIDTPPGYDQVGMLLDKVTLANATDLTTVFEDDFNDENVQYIPPACGTGANYVVVGGEPGPLESLMPEMTSNTEPSGEASKGMDGGGIGPEYAYFVTIGGQVFGTCPGGVVDSDQWWQYQFPAAQVVTFYSFRTDRINYGGIQDSPSEWLLQGSNNGSSWVTVDSRTGVTWNDIDNAPQWKTFAVASPGSYTYYRITVSDVAFHDGEVFSFGDFKLFGGGTGDPIYGYTQSYNCYGEGCLTEPPVAQLPDPEPLPDIEQGYTPPQTYSSTKTVCVSCPAGFTNRIAGPGELDQIILTAPNRKIFNWALGAGSIPTSLLITGSFNVGASYSLRGSNTSQVGTVGVGTSIIGGFTTGAGYLSLDIPSAGGFAFFQLDMSNSTGSGIEMTVTPTLYAAGPVSVCSTATRESEISQGDAITQATAAATASANLQLNCQQFWTATITHPAPCPCGTLGTAVSKTVTVISFVSQQDATDRATAEAIEQAEADLDCTQSNNGQPIQFNNGTFSSALPYPSVKYVSSLSGVVSKVTVSINQIRHLAAHTIGLVLMAPDGSAVMLLNMNNAGINTFFNGAVDLVFDDDAVGVMPHGSNIPGGTYKPTVEASGETEQLPVCAPTQPYGAVLSDFDGIDPNGSWALFVVTTQFVSVFNPANNIILGGWDLTITTV